MTDDTPPDLNIKQKLNLETAKLSWSELQTFFARGVVIVVNPELDLLEIAAYLCDDRSNEIERLITEGKITRATDEHARHWVESEPIFWAVVVAPWVLVQEIND
jgi:hypothetical protein